MDKIKSALKDLAKQVQGMITGGMGEIGFYMALQQGADLVASVDDDNIPYDDWGQDIVVGKRTEMLTYTPNCGVFDPLSVAEVPWIWHRGFPIQLVASRGTGKVGPIKIVPQVQANLWDGDPDIDATCDLQAVKFKRKDYWTSSCPMPFNTQNTIFSRKALLKYMSIPFIGRMDDIWGAYYLQALMPNSVAFGPATVNSVRNEHDITEDMKMEWVGNMHTLNMLEAMKVRPSMIRKFLPENARYALDVYFEMLEELPK